MEGNEKINYAPAEQVDKLAKNRTALAEKITAFSLEELVELESRLGIIIEGSDQEEGTTQERIIRAGILGYIKNPNSASWLETIEAKIKIIEDARH